MSLGTLKNEFNEDLLACRACLATNRKLYSLHQENLLKAYRNLVGQEVCPFDTLPHFMCNYCTTILLKFSVFRDHCIRATIYLDDARRRDQTSFNAKEHYKMHGGQMHECRHCGKSYEKLSSHLSHLRIHHASEFMWCDVCGEAFIGTFGLNAHKKRAHRQLSLPSTCRACAAQFVDEAALARHSSRGRCSERSCLHCGEGFTDTLQLREHLLDKHRSSTLYSCEKCHKSFTRESLYSAHYRRIHVDAALKHAKKKERPWICEVCGKSLPNKCMLVYHQRSHTGERPYGCGQCHKSFTLRKLLQSHLRVHTNDRPFACGSCPKAFKGLSALRTHEHIHSGGQAKTSKNTIKQ